MEAITTPNTSQERTMNLYDADTNEDLGAATTEQIEASLDERSGSGIILVDADGDVVADGGFGSEGARRVYAR